MIDLSHLPTSNRFYKEVFYPNSTVSGGAWYTWQKPRGINYIAIFAAAGGGGGAAGAVGANGALGGGGGGAPHSAKNIFLASALPDILYFSVGYGGAGGTTSAAAGSAGIDTYVGTFYGTGASPPASYLYFLNGGNGGTTGTGGVARAESGLASFNLIGNSFAGFGQNSNIAGRAGTAAGTALDLINASSNTFVNPGTGGGTLPASLFGSGGSYTATNGTFGPIFPSHLGGQTSDANGTNGYQVPGLFYFYGGTGAASGTASTVSSSGRRGGNGGPGSGGGGGGAAFTGSTVGAGGNGGPGFVIVIGW